MLELFDFMLGFPCFSRYHAFSVDKLSFGLFLLLRASFHKSVP